MCRWLGLAPEHDIIPQQGIAAPVVQQADVAQEMPRAMAERNGFWPIAPLEQPSTQAAQPCRLGLRGKRKSTDFNHLSHDRLVCFWRPRLTYASMVNLRSTFWLIKPILRGRA